MLNGYESDFIGLFVPRYISELIREEADNERSSVSHVIRDALCHYFKLEKCHAAKPE
jgi:hypothetical protein